SNCFRQDLLPPTQAWRVAQASGVEDKQASERTEPCADQSTTPGAGSVSHFQPSQGLDRSHSSLVEGRLGADRARVATVPHENRVPSERCEQASLLASICPQEAHDRTAVETDRPVGFLGRQWHGREDAEKDQSAASHSSSQCAMPGLYASGVLSP